jgi:drug/metabolite transporter (DMT)-like permease
MRPRDVVELIALAALWGGAFLFMRVAAPEFGPIPLIELRVAIAAAFLLVVLTVSDKLRRLGERKGGLFVVGVANSALPFCLLAYATLFVTAGFAAILNATSPLWAAVVAFVWLGTRLSGWRIFGLGLGFVGVVVLVWGRVSLTTDGAGLAILAGLGASLSYGIAANYTREHLSAVDPLVIATGSQIGAALALLPLALWTWPEQAVSARAWVTVVVMGIASTGIAYMLYFRLIAHVGPAKAITVTFLVPVFAVVWGYGFLDEALTLQMALGGAVVLLGTGISTGLIKPMLRTKAT